MKYLVLLLAVIAIGDCFRLVDEIGTGEAFRINEQGFVGFLGDPAVLKRERINPGSPSSIDQPLLFQDVNARQTCPSMVGPVGDNLYFCVAREYGYCDRRSGTCFCNTGYTGIDCSLCESTHFQIGYLCYPKKLCPKDCSGAGQCDYLTGRCSCLPHRQGEDCSLPLCSNFHQFCEACSFTECLRCRSGSSINTDTQACELCNRFDPRCSECSQDECLQCSDPLLNSIRRSGAKASDSSLPFDEYDRELSISLPFGTQDPDFFAEAEPFDIVSTLDDPLYDNAKFCDQGLNLTKSWSCFSANISHVICGHSGTVSFSSPLYAVNESDGHVRIRVRRSGGGFGNLDLEYWLKHIDTDLSDVSSTASYTTSQKLHFSEGIVELSFLIKIHDDVVHELTEKFQLVLRDLVSESGGVSYSPQLATTILIYDDDAYKTHYDYSRADGAGLVTSKAGETSYFTITAYSSMNRRQLVGGDDFFVQLEQERGSSAAYDEFREMGAIRGFVVDNGNGTYACSYSVERQGNFTIRVYYLRRGGLLGQYFDDPFMQKISFDRKDPYINNQWDYGAITALSADYVTVRWTGMIQSPVSGVVELMIIADDNCRLWVDGVLLIDSWTTPATDGVSASTTMEVDTFYDIIVEYREAGGLAFAEFYWSHDLTDGGEMEIIPSSSLFSKHELTKSSPAVVVVTSGDTSAITTECFGSGLSHATASLASYFECCPRDEYGNLRTDADSFFLATAWFSGNLDFDNSSSSSYSDDGDNSTHHELSVIMSYNYDTSCFDCQYTPIVSGSYLLSIYYGTWWDSNDTSHVFGSPFSVDIVPSSMFGRASKVSGNYEVVVCGNDLIFVITSFDVSGNLRNYETHFDEDVGQLVVVATHLYQPIAVFANISSMSNGSYLVDLLLTTSGEYQLSVFLRGGHTHDSPYRTIAHHASSYGPLCVPWGEGLSVARSGFSSYFYVQLRDVYDNNVTRNTAVDETIIECYLSSDLHELVTVNHVHIGNGTVRFDYIPFGSGVNNLTILVNGEHVIGSHYDVVVADGVTVADTSFAEGYGLITAVAGEDTSFTILSRDYKRNSRDSSNLNPVQDAADGNFSILMCRSEDLFNSSKATFSDNNATIQISSSYCVTGSATVLAQDVVIGKYKVNTSGYWDLYVLFSSVLDDGDDDDEFDVPQLRANHIRDSPFTVYVHPTYLSAEMTVVKGVGMRHVIAGENSEVFLHAVDRFGNLLEDGGDLMWMIIENGLTYDVFPSVDIGHGSYTITYRIPVSGSYRITLSTLESGLNVTYFESANPFNDGISLVDETLSFNWYAKNPLWNRLNEVYAFDLKLRVHNFSSDNFIARWNGFLIPLISIEPIEVIIESDENSISFVKIGRQDTSALSSLKLATSSVQSIAKGILKYETRQLIPIEIEYKHGFGPSFLNISWRSISYLQQVISAPNLLHTRNITHSSLTIFPNIVSPHDCTADGLGLHQTIAGVVNHFIVSVRDQYGNIQLVGGHKISVYGLGHLSYFVGHVTDLFNGTYLVEYNATTADNYRVFIAVGGNIGSFGRGNNELIASFRETEISGSPFLLIVSPSSVSPIHSSIHGEGSYSAIAGRESSFSVHLRDEHDNDLRYDITDISITFERLGDDKDDSSALISPAKLSISVIPFHRQGSVNIHDLVKQFSYILTQSGSYLLHVYLSQDGVEEELGGSPMTLTVAPSIPHTANCTARGTGLLSPASMKSNAILVRMIDVFGNRLVRGGESLVVNIVGQVDAMKRTFAIDLGNGEYRVGYDVSLPGKYELSIMLPSSIISAGDSFIGGSGLLREVYSYPETNQYAELISSNLSGPVSFSSSSSWTDQLVRAKSVEWTGYIKSPMRDWYSLCVESVQQVAVFLKGKQLISMASSSLSKGQCVVTKEMQHSWSQLDASVYMHQLNNNWGTMFLEENDMNYVRIILNCVSSGRDCALSLSWAGPSMEMQLVPKFFLHPPAEHIQGSPFTFFVSNE